MSLFNRLLLAAARAADVAWREGKYTFLVTLRGSQKQLSEGEAWIKAFDDLDRKEREAKEKLNGTR